MIPQIIRTGCLDDDMGSSPIAVEVAMHVGRGRIVVSATECLRVHQVSRLTGLLVVFAGRTLQMFT